MASARSRAKISTTPSASSVAAIAVDRVAGPVAGLRRAQYKETVGRQVLVALYVLAMVVIIVGVDVLFLKHQFLPRLLVNIGIVVVFAAIYFAFIKRP